MTEALTHEQEQVHTEAATLKEQMQVIVINDDDTFSVVGQVVKEADMKIKRVEEVFGLPKKKAYESYKASNDLYNAAMTPLKEIKKMGRAKMGAYQEQQRRKAEEIRRKAEEESRENTDVGRLPGLLHEQIHGEPLHAGHGFDRIPDAFARDHEERVDEVVGRHPRLPQHRPQRGGSPQAPRPVFGEAGHQLA